MKEREFGVLENGQTTASLASLAVEKNEVATLYEKVADTFSEAASRVTSSKTDAPPGRKKRKPAAPG
jgi:hypothetical protein